ncbi:radical SAM family heme chaperone HemW [Aquicella lusitana]|uniref:Heme chaperone HemW n=1 Tax=Aquicella lusitana TaxID=254246 RepID=A0A370G9R5_9COXI|nr:radical SAM family heme chaperone HemW [Aquicella lusitana]RDI39204.1 anaerobic coproporphyrinogen III oxidase [Aquicella lusitana]VVC74063.1 Oxygen-independent coproporphyrinogen-III oxidase-like protein YqeR [Aquicella lusitana]
MPIFTENLPLSLYIHIPWCVRKCPYCDFNSHEARSSLPEADYVNALLQELDAHLPLVHGRPLTSIFFGGGTPSLLSGNAIEQILEGISKRMALNPQIEITLEANPGTIDQARFNDFHRAGINRLSLGIQSLQNDKLKKLGRIHDRDHALRAISCALSAGFTNFNLDLMYGLPDQTIEDALQDIDTALAFHPPHFSWYQLTIEPNTLFYHQPPVLPHDDMLWEMQLAGQQRIAASGLQQYEVSAYAQPQKACAHNLNYWTFGDYLGIGAGSHSKITDPETGKVVRFSQVRHPKDYLNPAKRLAPFKTVSMEDLIFEFMLNVLRLTHGIPASLFTLRTGLPLSVIEPLLAQAKEKGLLLDDSENIVASTLGKQFLNDLITLFLPKTQAK